MPVQRAVALGLHRPLGSRRRKQLQRAVRENWQGCVSPAASTVMRVTTSTSSTLRGEYYTVS